MDRGRLRGWTTFSDAFFPLAFLNFGQGINFLWWWVFNHILAPMLACYLLLIILLRGKQLTPSSALLAGTCLVVLSLSGPGGLPYVLALALWLGYRGRLFWRFRPNSMAGVDCLLVMGVAVLAVLLVGLYFVGYTSALGIVAGQRLPAVSLKASLEASIQVLSISLGPAVKPYWRLAGPAVLTLLLLSVAVLIVALLKEPRERLRALGLLLFIGAAGSLVLIVGRARAGLGEEYALVRHLSQYGPSGALLRLLHLDRLRQARYQHSSTDVHVYRNVSPLFPKLGHRAWDGQILQ